MSMINKIKEQFNSVIQWENQSPDALLEMWNNNGDEIKNASKLIVGPGEGCIFVYEGRIKSILEKECSVNLETANIPFWTTVKKFMQFFESEHKAKIYFFKKTRILDQKWGTKSPIKYDDPKYKFPVGLQAFGNYSYQINDPKLFFTEITGGSNFYIEDFRKIISGRIVQPLSDFLATSKFSFSDIDANRNEIADEMNSSLNAVFLKLGFKITDFRIEGTGFDEDTLRRINRISDLIAESQAAQVVGMDYVGFEKLQALRDASKNEGGGAGIGMGMGAGIGMGQMMSDMMIPEKEKVEPSVKEKLEKLKKFYEDKLISEEEYKTKKKEVLDVL